VLPAKSAWRPPFGTANRKELAKALKARFNPGRFPILDALRGIFAMVVALGHVGTPPIFGSSGQSEATWGMLTRIVRTFAFGPPAVIGFFVISGFCIHYAFADPRTPMPWVRFYLRRYLRIGLPILAVILICSLYLRSGVMLLGKNSILWNSTLWSLLCEELYYGVYPILLITSRIIGMRWVFFCSILPCYLIIVSTFPTVDWTDLGILQTSLVLLPVWLAGAILAEWTVAGELPATTPAGIAMWRLGAWVVMWLSLVAHFHLGLHQTASSVLVGIFAFYWLRAELAASSRSRPLPIFVWLGSWSYSLYLIHPLVVLALAKHDINPAGSMGLWLYCMTLILVCAYGFYRVIEAPSHRLAKVISLSRRSAATPALAEVVS
jgi:peptidoglycan/LPS O-acetylase OafA/YrhL